MPDPIRYSQYRQFILGERGDSPSGSGDFRGLIASEKFRLEGLLADYEATLSLQEGSLGSLDKAEGGSLSFDRSGQRGQADKFRASIRQLKRDIGETRKRLDLIDPLYVELFGEGAKEEVEAKVAGGLTDAEWAEVSARTERIRSEVVRQQARQSGVSQGLQRPEGLGVKVFGLEKRKSQSKRRAAGEKASTETVLVTVGTVQEAKETLEDLLAKLSYLSKDKATRETLRSLEGALKLVQKGGGGEEKVLSYVSKVVSEATAFLQASLYHPETDDPYGGLALTLENAPQGQQKKLEKGLQAVLLLCEEYLAQHPQEQSVVLARQRTLAALSSLEMLDYPTLAHQLVGVHGSLAASFDIAAFKARYQALDKAHAAKQGISEFETLVGTLDPSMAAVLQDKPGLLVNRAMQAQVWKWVQELELEDRVGLPEPDVDGCDGVWVHETLLFLERRFALSWVKEGEEDKRFAGQRLIDVGLGLTKLAAMAASAAQDPALRGLLGLPSWPADPSRSRVLLALTEAQLETLGGLACGEVATTEVGAKGEDYKRQWALAVFQARFSFQEREGWRTTFYDELKTALPNNPDFQERLAIYKPRAGRGPMHQAAEALLTPQVASDGGPLSLVPTPSLPLFETTVRIQSQEGDYVSVRDVLAHALGTGAQPEDIDLFFELNPEVVAYVASLKDEEGRPLVADRYRGEGLYLQDGMTIRLASIFSPKGLGQGFVLFKAAWDFESQNKEGAAVAEARRILQQQDAAAAIFLGQDAAFYQAQEKLQGAIQERRLNDQVFKEALGLLAGGYDLKKAGVLSPKDALAYQRRLLSDIQALSTLYLDGVAKEGEEAGAFGAAGVSEKALKASLQKVEGELAQALEHYRGLLGERDELSRRMNQQTQDAKHGLAKHAEPGLVQKLGEKKAEVRAARNKVETLKKQRLALQEKSKKLSYHKSESTRAVLLVQTTLLERLGASFPKDAASQALRRELCLYQAGLYGMLSSQGLLDMRSLEQELEDTRKEHASFDTNPYAVNSSFIQNLEKSESGKSITEQKQSLFEQEALRIQGWVKKQEEALKKAKVLTADKTEQKNLDGQIQSLGRDAHITLAEAAIVLNKADAVLYYERKVIDDALLALTGTASWNISQSQLGAIYQDKEKKRRLLALMPRLVSYVSWQSRLKPEDWKTHFKGYPSPAQAKALLILLPENKPFYLRGQALAAIPKARRQNSPERYQQTVDHPLLEAAQLYLDKALKASPKQSQQSFADATAHFINCCQEWVTRIGLGAQGSVQKGALVAFDKLAELLLTAKAPNKENQGRLHRLLVLVLKQKAFAHAAAHDYVAVAGKGGVTDKLDKLAAAGVKEATAAKADILSTLHKDQAGLLETIYALSSESMEEAIAFVVVGTAIGVSMAFSAGATTPAAIAFAAFLGGLGSQWALYGYNMARNAGNIAQASKYRLANSTVKDAAIGGGSMVFGEAMTLLGFYHFVKTLRLLRTVPDVRAYFQKALKEATDSKSKEAIQALLDQSDAAIQKMIWTIRLSRAGEKMMDAGGLLAGAIGLGGMGWMTKEGFEQLQETQAQGLMTADQQRQFDSMVVDLFANIALYGVHGYFCGRGGSLSLLAKQAKTFEAPNRAALTIEAPDLSPAARVDPTPEQETPARPRNESEGNDLHRPAEGENTSEPFIPPVNEGGTANDANLVLDDGDFEIGMAGLPVDTMSSEKTIRQEFLGVLKEPVGPLKSTCRLSLILPGTISITRANGSIDKVSCFSVDDGLVFPVEGHTLFLKDGVLRELTAYEVLDENPDRFVNLPDMELGVVGRDIANAPNGGKAFWTSQGVLLIEGSPPAHRWLGDSDSIKRIDFLLEELDGLTFVGRDTGSGLWVGSRGFGDSSPVLELSTGAVYRRFDGLWATPDEKIWINEKGELFSGTPGAFRPFSPGRLSGDMVATSDGKVFRKGDPLWRGSKLFVLYSAKTSQFEGIGRLTGRGKVARITTGTELLKTSPDFPGALISIENEYGVEVAKKILAVDGEDRLILREWWPLPDSHKGRPVLILRDKDGLYRVVDSAPLPRVDDTCPLAHGLLDNGTRLTGLYDNGRYRPLSLWIGIKRGAASPIPTTAEKRRSTNSR